ncbi:MAG TPA: TAT-variant-translocated molybdopterin oxidoreductase [Pirellulales bacterium]|jgi:MoCo/4Fe-4S cofactor protein with predicted Tat translocation signal|nr:TAT-variant-translocated molybdopterin oxidoreductase [Pirellulales bacterium]
MTSTLLPILDESCRAAGCESRGQARRTAYWRSLDELAETADFKELLAREFPSQLAVWDDPVGRRNFLKLMAASFALAGITGCTREPLETIVPYVRAQPEITPGRPLYFATAMTRGGYALGLLAESHMGRPTKLEGNPDHPASLGATDALAQASILDLYDPDRSQTVIRRSVIETWDHFLTALTTELGPIRERRGEGLRILTERVTSPTLARQLEALLEDLPEANWHQFDPAGFDNAYEGARQAFGRTVETRYDFSRADIIVSLDADFLSTLPASLRYAREFIDGRRVSARPTSMNRLYVIESTPTITGAMADHHLARRPSLIEPAARMLAGQLGLDVGQPSSAAAEDIVPQDWLRALVSDLNAHRGAGLVIAGEGQPPSVHALAHAINQALGNVGSTVIHTVPVMARPRSGRESFANLVSDMHAGRVDTLVMLGGNPVFTAPGMLDFEQALAQVRLRVHLSEYYDETSFLCDWHVPAAHYLESWGDARAYDGTATIMQPLIAPLYGGRTAYELVAALAGKGGQSSYEIVQDYWRGELGEANFGDSWQRAVHDGVIPQTAADTLDVRVTSSFGNERASPDAPPFPDGELEAVFRPDPTIWDGRFANNAWLQELPKPLTKLTWDNAAYLSPATAEQRALANGDVIEITLEGRSIEAPVWTLPGQADGCVSLTLGYGRSKSGRVGTGLGYNAYTLRPNADAWFAHGASIRKTGGHYKLVTTQGHHNMEGRDIVRVHTFEQLQSGAAGQHKHDAEPLPSLYPEYEYTGNAWGMVIDQTACIGCNACVAACQAENNIPTVGKDQVAVGREMQWLRIDRYYHGSPQDPETYFQPMMCLHCEMAPCEVVCPVAATVHDSEGTNNMIYNRCVGTRYCSNNCPYKVRRFNYLQYTDEITPSLKLMRNPDVTVRSRGVMEKCSYCIQRISHARIDAKREMRPIRDGEVITACQQACPTRAIVFGNLNDTAAEVRKLKGSPLNYGVLAELNTQPRTTHLARVTNPHPDLAAPAGDEPKPRDEGNS